MKNALVVGGTGMLSEASIQLAKEYVIVGVIGRTEVKMDSVVGNKNIVPLLVDYSDSKALDATLSNFSKKYGKAELVVSWIHGTSPGATQIVAKYCSTDFYEITGSFKSSNYSLSLEHEKEIAIMGLNYHRIVLDKINGRWLTNAEISQGVLGAIRSAATESVIGSK